MLIGGSMSVDEFFNCGIHWIFCSLGKSYLSTFKSFFLLDGDIPPAPQIHNTVFSYRAATFPGTKWEKKVGAYYSQSKFQLLPLYSLQGFCFTVVSVPHSASCFLQNTFPIFYQTERGTVIQILKVRKLYGGLAS